MALNDLNQYSYGGIAAGFVEKKAGPFVKKSLERLVDNISAGNPTLAAKIKPFVTGSFASDKGIAEASKGAGEIYEAFRNEADTNALYTEHYSTFLADYISDEAKPKFSAVFSAYAGRKFGDIVTEFKKNLEIAKSKTDNFTDAQKSSAKVVVEKYQNLMGTVEALENAKLSVAQREFSKGIITEELDELASQL